MITASSSPSQPCRVIRKLYTLPVSWLSTNRPYFADRFGMTKDSPFILASSFARTYALFFVISSRKVFSRRGYMLPFSSLGPMFSNVTSSFIAIQFLCSARIFSFVCWSAKSLNLLQRLFNSVSHITKNHLDETFISPWVWAASASGVYFCISFSIFSNSFCRDGEPDTRLSTSALISSE